jgi:hypothetical protein
VSAARRKAVVSRVGTTFDGFRLKRLVGLGGMGAVYAASREDGVDWALKVLHPEWSTDPDSCRRFTREAYLANEVGHADVPRVVANGMVAGAPYSVMELLDGLSVDRCVSLAGGRLQPHDVLEVAARLLSVLAVAHARGIVHRDIKPSNLFRTRAPARLKVLDFGVAGGLRHPTEETALTLMGSMLGTPQFMAPEQARGCWPEVDAQSDLWSVGATLFLLLTGRHVHAGRTPEETFGAAMLKPAAKLENVDPGMPPAVCRVVNGAIGFEKRERWRDASAMLGAVEEGLAQLGRQDSARFFAEENQLGSFAAARALEPGATPEPITDDATGEGVLDTLAFARSGRILVVAHTEKSPSDAEWTRWIARMSMNDYEHILISTTGGGPSATQRKRTNLFWEGKEIPRFALLTESRAVIGIVGVFNWFLDNRLRAFHPCDSSAALGYLEVPERERAALLDTVQRLRRSLTATAPGYGFSASMRKFRIQR